MACKLGDEKTGAARIMWEAASRIMLHAASRIIVALDRWSLGCGDSVDWCFYITARSCLP